MGFYNMRLGIGGLMQISFTHVLFFLPIIALVWMLADESAKSQYQWEIIVLWFSHFSRLIGIAVKYSHLNKYTFHQFKNADMGEAQVIQANMMLPSGWFEPQLERWFHHLDDAEHLTNRTIGLHTLTLAHGLKQPMTYVGEVSVSKIKELIQPSESETGALPSALEPASPSEAAGERFILAILAGITLDKLQSSQH